MFDALILAVAGLFLLICFLGGLLWREHKWVPIVVTGLVIAGYAIYMIADVVWASHCWSCADGGRDSRAASLVLAAAFVWIIPAVLIAVTWVGALVSTIVRMANAPGNETHA